MSAKAKGWLLVKHHFATSSIIHQHVKSSALISFSHVTPVYSSFFSRSYPIWLFSGRRTNQAKPKNKTESTQKLDAGLTALPAISGKSIPMLKKRAAAYCFVTHYLTSGRAPMIHSWTRAVCVSHSRESDFMLRANMNLPSSSLPFKLQSSAVHTAHMIFTSNLVWVPSNPPSPTVSRIDLLGAGSVPDSCPEWTVRNYLQRRTN